LKKDYTISRSSETPHISPDVANDSANTIDPNVSVGSFLDLGARSCEVRFTSMSRHREFDHLRPKSAIKRRDGLHDFSRSLFVLSPRLVAAKKKGLRIADLRLSKSVERAV
jgi:hypothetical protein